MWKLPGVFLTPSYSGVSPAAKLSNAEAMAWPRSCPACPRHHFSPKLSIQVRESFSNYRMRSLLAQLRSQSLDERNQNLSLDLDLFNHRDVHISVLEFPLA